MTTRVFAFDPFDTFWFRDGRAFEQTDDGLAEARAIFPPSPATLAGAFVSAAVNALAPSTTDVSKPWSELRGPGEDIFAAFSAITGLPEPWAEGQVGLSGPLIVVDGEVWCPFPATLAIHGDAPRDGAIAPEYLATRLPVEYSGAGGELGITIPISRENRDLEAFGDGTGLWLRLADLVEHLDSSDRFLTYRGAQLRVLAASGAFVRESRIGVALNPTTRAAEAGQLFASQHLRPSHRVSGNWRSFEKGARLATLAFDPANALAGLPSIAPAYVGGKGRPSRLERRSIDIDALLFRTGQGQLGRREGGRLRFRITALAPIPVDGERAYGLPTSFGADEDEDVWRTLRAHAAALPQKPVAHGLWRTFGAERASILRAFPAGSTWFVSLDEGALQTAGSDENWVRRSLWNRRFAPRDIAPLGFGLALAGEWPAPAEFRTRISA